MPPIGVVGGSSGRGYGLVLRLAAAGEPIVIASRSLERARAAARAVRERLPRGVPVEARSVSDTLARCERLVLALPLAGLPDLLRAGRSQLSGKLVIDAMLPLRIVDGHAEVASLPEARSVGEFLQSALPCARVVSAFKTLPPTLLARLDAPLDADVPLCGDQAGAVAEVIALVARIPGLRPVDLGGIAGARHLEALASLLVTLGLRHRTEVSVRFTGLDDAVASPGRVVD